MRKRLYPSLDLKKGKICKTSLLMWLVALLMLPAMMFSGCAKKEKDNGRLWSEWLNRREGGLNGFLVEDDMMIPDGIDIDGVAVGGHTAEEARSLLQSRYDSEQGFNVTLMWDGVSAGTMSTKQLGFKADSEAALLQAISVGETGSTLRQYRTACDIASGQLHIETPKYVDGGVIEAFVKNIDEENEVVPVDATIKMNNGVFVVSESKDGYGADIEATSKAVKSAIALSTTDVTIDVVTETRHPHYTTEDLSKVHDVLGTYSTHYDKVSSTREHNVRLATSRLGNLTLMPGEQASASALMLKRTEENGYQTGNIYVNGAVESGIGGGVCQVASTLYNALLLSEVQVDERFNHSMVVSYVRPGRDATISEDYKDLKFTNNLEYPIYIASDSDGVDVTFTIYGVETRPANRTVEYPVTKIYEVENPGGSPEMEVYLEKVVLVDGKEVERKKLHSDYYQASTPAAATGETDSE